MAAVEVKVLKRKAPPELRHSLKDRLLADLEARLPGDAFAFAMPDTSSCFVPRRARDGGLRMRSIPGSQGLPGIIIIHHGRALGLELGPPGDCQRTLFPRLRAAGMRIEVARSFAEAITLLGEMGLLLRAPESLSRQVAEIFREARHGRQGSKA